MLIKYTEWRNAVKCTSTYDSTEVWNRVKKELKDNLEINDIELPTEILEKINEDTITAILTGSNEADWTDDIEIEQHLYYSTTLHDFLEELCENIEYDIVNYNYEIEDYGDVIDWDRKEVS